MLGIAATIDSLLAAWLPPLVVIMLWAAVSATFSMCIYALLSPQKRLLELKMHHRHVRKMLFAHEGDFKEMQTLIGKDLGIALKQMAFIFIPFLCSVIPVFALMFCLFALYEYRLPEAGSRIAISVTPPHSTLIAAPADSLQPTDNAGAWSMTWPDASKPVTLYDENHIALLTLPASHAISGITKPDWLTTLFPNPLGVIDKEALINEIHMDLPARHYIHVGPDWMRGFTFWYLAMLLVASLLIKIRFRII